MALDVEQIRAFVEYLRDLGVYDWYRRDSAGMAAVSQLLGEASKGVRAAEPAARVADDLSADERTNPASLLPIAPTPLSKRRNVAELPEAVVAKPNTESSIPKPIPFDDLAPLPEVRVAAKDKAAALSVIRQRIGDCTRCPLAYAGRHTIVFGDGDPNAKIFFVGEGPGADEDASGLPFVGKAGQLLNNMIGAMGLSREQVYIANIVKCRPPQNRAPEPVEANTCSRFLLEQMDAVQPKVVVALGSTAATYLLGVKQSLSSLRGRWHACRGAKLVVTYHPAFLLRDPRQKGEAWKDLQMAMAELGLKAAVKG